MTSPPKFKCPNCDKDTRPSKIGMHTRSLTCGCAEKFITQDQYYEMVDKESKWAAEQRAIHDKYLEDCPCYYCQTNGWHK